MATKSQNLPGNRKMIKSEELETDQTQKMNVEGKKSVLVLVASKMYSIKCTLSSQRKENNGRPS